MRTRTNHRDFESLLGMLAAAGTGAGLMYLLDPRTGRRRRAGMRDQIVHEAHALNTGLERAGRDLKHRAVGAVERARSSLDRKPVSDDVLRDRVRAEIGRVVTHPSSIEVWVDDGRVSLTGPILKREKRRLLQAVDRIHGVRDVADVLETHKTAERVPGLQGNPRRAKRGRQLDIFQENWAPATRLVTTVLGAGLGVRALQHRSLLSPGFLIAGTCLALRGLTNMPMKRIFGLRAGRRAVDLQKTITVYAPIDEVFRFWTNIENFPRFMQHVKRVEILDEARSRWTVAGPAGIDVEWDATITRQIPNRVLAWRTRPGATVEHAGIVHFEELDEGGTRLHIRLAYNPPAGAIGHVIAKLFGKDPKTAMDEDLVRMKSLLELGKTSAHGDRISLDELPMAR